MWLKLSTPWLQKKYPNQIHRRSVHCIQRILNKVAETIQNKALRSFVLLQTEKLPHMYKYFFLFCEKNHLFPIINLSPLKTIHVLITWSWRIRLVPRNISSWLQVFHLKNGIYLQPAMSYKRYSWNSRRLSQGLIADLLKQSKYHTEQIVLFQGNHRCT